MEGQNRKKYGQLVPLSEQQLIDCTTANGENGCNGGLPDYAFNYILASAASSSNSEIRQMGLDTERNYQYTGQVVPTHGHVQNVSAGWRLSVPFYFG
jgi:cathepsin L